MEELHFYPSKIRNFLLLIMGIVFSAFGFLICVAAFNDGDYFHSALGATLGLFFAVVIIVGFKKFFSSEPYLILTKEELILSASSKNPIPIKWKDIEGYRIREIKFNKFVEILLHDDEKYIHMMTVNARRLIKLNQAMNFAPFAIVWGQIKRKDQEKLVHELDRRTFEENVANNDPKHINCK